MAKVINLNKKDTQGVVPLCLLVMNMTPFEKFKENKMKELNEMKDSAEKSDFAKSAANFFAMDLNQDRSKLMNKSRKVMMRLLLSGKDENGER